MYRILTTVAVLLTMVLVGCSSEPMGPDKKETLTTPESLTLSGDSTSSERSQGNIPNATSGNITYASELRLIGWSDWIVTFYLPYNPGIVTFQGHFISGGQWQTFSGSWAQIWDARYTANGFRVQILMGARVFYPCGPQTSRYRLLY
jgi:hypothetical protein